MHILLVEDNSSDKALITSLLDKSKKYTYHTVRTLKEAKAYLMNSEETTVEMILMDLNLPDSPDTNSYIDVSNDAIPTIIITGTDDMSVGRIALRNGAQDYLIKGAFGSDVLYKTIEYASERFKRTHSKIKRLQECIIYDELTGVHNRYSLNQRISEEWPRCRRNGQDLTIAILDIDYFKQFNDNYGHLQGDIALRTVAQEIDVQLKRPADFVARFGGEEFVVLLPDTTDPTIVLERCCKAVLEQGISHVKSPYKYVTISIGSATVSPKEYNGTPEKVLEFADKELYKAKESGRNKISLIRL